MVFQNYAIFPHLSVKGNVAFGLTNRNVSKADIDRRVDEILKTVEMLEHKDSMPDKLSGGQQQRIALARAIVIHPDILLMDEPLSNLDAKLRVSMRNAIKAIQKSVNITTIYVTHDQEEAMAVSDRIAIMHAGVLQHIGTPRNIYHRPANTFVATFIGHSNILNAHLVNGKLQLTNDYAEPMNNLDLPAGVGNDTAVLVSVRPEEFIVIKGDTAAQNALGATVKGSTYLGLNTHYVVQLDSGVEVEIVEESTLTEEIKTGARIGLQVKSDKINVFDSDGAKNFTKGVVNDA
jgi:iron(III) transport system ATP-binding protein